MCAVNLCGRGQFSTDLLAHLGFKRMVSCNFHDKRMRFKTHAYGTKHGNTVDRFAVAVVKGSNIVGHVPMEYSRIFCYTSFKSVTALSSVRSVDLDVCLK